jgi:sialic acid synthase SpsE
MAKGLGELRAMFGQSLVTTSDLAEGTVLEATHLSCRKPMEGIPAGDYKSVLGRRLRRNLVEGSFLKKDDID